MGKNDININKYMDHTFLKAEAGKEDIDRLCSEAIEYGFFAVCVNSCYVKKAVERLKGTYVVVAAVVGFPLGAAATEVKAFEAEFACKEGAKEIDMVINVGALKDGDIDYVRQDIGAVVKAAHKGGATVKVILETCLLDRDEIKQGCMAAAEEGADYVKTSTGFSSGGATVEDVMLMKATVGDKLKIKASGGIRDLKTALEMIDAGADRLGVSTSVEIVKEY